MEVYGYYMHARSLLDGTFKSVTTRCACANNYIIQAIKFTKLVIIAIKFLAMEKLYAQ